MPTRAADFRYIFANVLGMSFSDNEAKLVFGVEEAGGPEASLEQVGIVMTHRTLKLLGRLINETVTHYENRTGTTIYLDETRVEKVRETLDKINPPTD